jgi:hypothetical protein
MIILNLRGPPALDPVIDRVQAKLPLPVQVVVECMWDRSFEECSLEAFAPFGTWLHMQEFHFLVPE